MRRRKLSIYLNVSQSGSRKSSTCGTLSHPKPVIRGSSSKVMKQTHLMNLILFFSIVVLSYWSSYSEATLDPNKPTSDRGPRHINLADVGQYSANNRGPPALARAAVDDSEWSFGLRKWPLGRLSKVVSIGTQNLRLKRTDAASKNVVWSQPDPRKSYSRPLVSMSAPLVLVQQPPKHLPSSISLTTRPATTTTPVPTLNLSSENRLDESFPPPVIQQKLPEMLTLIRYVPVLVGVPAAGLPDDGTRLSSQQRTWPEPGMSLDGDLIPEQQTSSWSTILADPFTGESQYSNPLRSLYMYLPSIPAIPIQSQPPHSQRLPATPYLQQTAASSSTSSARALSNYAARFFSMLRPASLLSSVMAQSANSQPAHVYLISAAPSTQPELLPQTSLRQVLPTHGEPTRALRQVDSVKVSGHLFRHDHPPAGTWSHPYGNTGYICVHSLHHRAPVKQPPTPSVSSQILLPDELATFDELPITTSTTRSPETSTSLEDLVTVAGKSGGPDTESVSGKLRGSAQVAPKSSLTTSTTTSTTTKPLARIQQTSEPQKVRLDTLASRRLSFVSSSGEPIIPFTIRDKIERQSATLAARTPPQAALVDLHEPVDSSSAPAVNEAPKEPPPTRTARTSFLSQRHQRQHRSRKAEPSASALEVDYNRELGARSDPLPLLLASTRRYTSPTPGPKWASGSDVELASSSSSLVSTSSTLDGKPVILSSGPLLPLEAGAGSIKPPYNSSTTTKELTTEHGFTSSHNKQLSGIDDSMDEFGRLSESLQKNPMDLVDLQNSRSSFELPSQLESLSMLHEQQQQQHWQASSTEQSK